MPLNVLAPMVILGIGAIALLTYVLGFAGRARLSDRAIVETAWTREFPEDRPHQVILGADGRAAFVQTARGPGVVWVMGADTTARYLTGASLDRRANVLTLTLPDFAAPRVRMILSEDDPAAERFIEELLP